MRSKWKGFYLNQNMYYNYFFSTNNTTTYVATRNSAIIFKFVNEIFYIYTGTFWVKLKISEALEKKKFGCFAFTKEVVKHQKKKKK